ncbi:MAG: helix-turn-helix domain-containing protein [Gemmataceae bacterium]|nr:helix-turn-helix domain-containing protein [Gemmataceae bacterium]
MAQDYYTLEEAARIVNLSPEDLKQMARRGELRSFQDRGTWRFRVQDIQELARRRGLSSDPELVLGEAPIPRPSDSPAPRSPAPRSPGPRSPAPSKGREGEVFDFSLGADDDIGVGQEMALDLPPSSGRKPGGASPGRRPRQEGPRSPARTPQPPPGSDSDVRLVAEGSDVDFQVHIDSDAQLAEDSGVSSGQARPRSASRTGTSPESPPPRAKPAPKSSKVDLGPPSSPQPPAPDSGVRLVPMDSDSDVRIVGASSDEADLGTQPPRSSADSDIRVEGQATAPPPSDAGHMTEEINLDEELRRQEQGKQRQAKVRPKAPKPQQPATSPFELSEDDLSLPGDSQVPGVKPDTSDFELTPAKEPSSPLEPGSSDFELTPAGASPLEPTSDEEFHLEVPDDSSVGLGTPKAGRRPTSGISLEAPADSGISLEQGGDGSDEIEFNLTLEGGATPRPSAPQPPGSTSDSDSEFELTLDSDEGRLTADSDSEFELTLDAEPQARQADSDSEFELTLDDSGSLSPLEQPRQVKAGQEKDIFETDFDVPGLEDESGSQAVALDDADTGLGSSDFDLQLDDDESGSAVVALDEDADDMAATVQRQGRMRRTKIVDADEAGVAAEEFQDLDDEGVIVDEDEEALVEEEEAPGRTVVKEKLLPAAPWGAMPVFLMLPCVLIMFAVALMGLELAQSVAGHKSPGLITRALGGIFGGPK